MKKLLHILPSLIFLILVLSVRISGNDPTLSAPQSPSESLSPSATTAEATVVTTEPVVTMPSETTVATQLPTPTETISLPNEQPIVSATTAPPTIPTSATATTVPETMAPVTQYYSTDPKVIAFIEERIYTWTLPVKDGFLEVTGTRVFAASRSNGTRAHAGIDFEAPHGTKVYAITSGTVHRVALFYQGTYAVEVHNDDGSVLRYCEISTSLKAGDRVEQGDVIGAIKRATSGTEMLHVELYYGDGEGMLTQRDNKQYAYVSQSKLFQRRSDLMDPTFLKDLKPE